MSLRMEATATEGQVYGLIARLERDGLSLSTNALEKIHKILTDSTPDNRSEGTQKMLCQLIRERCDRDDK